ncbi:MAG: phosphoglycerate dehydrogenase [Gemmatimonadales bacterium]|nr:phosphoglycerate dehydrogenase [Gemmatimonadota bacterium]MCC7132922.1 phosphoglycerate dehydrogenase [Gemmatimonadales bacterium]MDX2056814.1 phosphoglycerate dehydrogenase [Gemmatimonadales bacterium]
MPYRILVTDEIDREGVDLLRAVADFEVDEVPTLPADELLRRIPEYDAIVGRSATRISEALLQAATRLKVVGRAGVGVDNVAIDVATRLGVAVINAPAGNTIAVAELWFGVMLGLLRHLTRADASMHAGRWDRSDLLGTELKGRTLGIVGLGRIGGEVATRARAFGMKVIGFDPYIAEERFTALGVARMPTLDALCDAADILTVHTPLTAETRKLIGAPQLARLRPGAIVANLARGGIVDDEALRAALVSGHLSGAALDVYAAEPLKGDHPWRGLDQVVLTPHIGASTAEAQRNVAVDACAAVRDALLRGDLSRSLNVTMPAGDWTQLQPVVDLATRAAVVARTLLADRGARAIESVTLKRGADLAAAATTLLSAAALGTLEGVVDESRLNLINARAIATSRGITLGIAEDVVPAHPRGLVVRVVADGQEMRIGGVAPLDAPARLSQVGPFHVDVAPRETLLVLTNRDVPGVIGHVGTALGDAGVNIAEYHQARLKEGGEALAVISVDGPGDPGLRDTLLAIPDVQSASVIRFQADE